MSATISPFAEFCLTRVGRVGRMGLEALDASAWLREEPGDADLLAERARLLAERRSEVMAWTPDSTEAVAELAREVEAWLRQRGRVGLLGQTLADGEVEERLARLAVTVAEDLCLIDVGAPEPRLIAGVVCFPNRWSLGEKIGASMVWIHRPVPEYANRLAVPVDRFLQTLDPGMARGRLNWSLCGHSDWFQAYHPEREPDIDGPWLRLEWQTFRRLPASGAVLFAIRTLQTPWRQAPQATREDLLAQIAAMPPAWSAYKGIDGLRSRL